MVQKKKSVAISSVSANTEAENSEKASEKKKQTPSGSSQNADKTTESRNKQLPNAKASIAAYGFRLEQGNAVHFKRNEQ